ncbi:hypothetical protein diail_12196 [Diaporthe ilicicola]|nr:hypothetical protein diail_12196 [Diaporthe ilicicola]
MHCPDREGPYRPQGLGVPPRQTTRRIPESPGGLTPLFTNKALSTYMTVHERVNSGYFEKFVNISKASEGRPVAFMTMFREINCALSCRSFFGDYISQDAIKKIADDFYLATAAMELVNVPLSMYIPGTKQWLGKRTCDAVHAEFAKCAAACKKNMTTGATPTCVVDYWVLHMLESKRYRERIAAGETDVEKPSNLIREFTDEEIGETLFTFLFASQDAESSATTWLFQILAQRPDVLDRVRQENLDARGGDKNKPFDLPMLESLTYTNAVIKELLRHRPPVIFVPYLATKDFPVTPTYTVPKGSMIIPSCYPALHDPVDYPNPDHFDPERWISGDAESKTKNWLVFGAGPHDCLARRYGKEPIHAYNFSSSTLRLVFTDARPNRFTGLRLVSVMGYPTLLEAPLTKSKASLCETHPWTNNKCLSTSLLGRHDWQGFIGT